MGSVDSVRQDRVSENVTSNQSMHSLSLIRELSTSQTHAVVELALLKLTQLSQENAEGQ